ncbi:Nucleoside-diphosphate-sugar epimerase [Chlorella sorokiniana]|uniref:Nucleoside-diphosphate-sugar epimerase n=1 Tax=Chlorella sorokiniana TaxID=3076 RepID=A0A2P6TE65_CHLSO|nr:Nucleoside-diphosphate-sugar epimerase [Chlorella sorokiniana]|eukprot:PRW20922.1 Nucleoside-diphosphate-sugar epimerase [Chlorella sorokiniana]
MKAALPCALALLLVAAAASAAADGAAADAALVDGPKSRKLLGCGDLCRGLTRGPVARRICPGRTATVYGAKKTYPCGWESRSRALGSLSGGTRITYLSSYGNAPGSSFGLSLPAGVDMIPLIDNFSNIDNQCVVWVRHDYVCNV